MSTFLWYYSLRIALAMLTIGKVSASTKLTILNNQSDLKCKTMQTVLTCELQKPLEWSMYWWVDNSRVSECNTSSCDRKDGMPTNYNTTVTNVGNVFKLYIDPVDIFDNKTFTCTDGDVSNGIRITTEEVKMNKLLTTFTNKTVDNNVVFNVTTNCVFHPSAVNLSLESKKVNGNGGFTSFPVNITNKTTVCSNTENAYCGGNKTKKLNLNFPISTDTKGGEMHQFRLHLIQTLENGTNHTITFEIGQLKLPGKVNASTELTILNNQSHLKCGTMQTELTCERQVSRVWWDMHWLVDNLCVSTCNKTSCNRKDGMPTNYNTTVTNDGNIFKLYINPVDIFDNNKTFTCTDGILSNEIRITTEEVKMNKLLTTFTNKTVNNNVVFNVTTNCVFHPSAVNLSLESKKVNGNGGFTSFPVNITNKTTVCSNTENAYCGGYKTKKLNLNFPISTDTKGGKMHQFRLHLIQTLENGTNHTITFEIGQLKLPVNDSRPVSVQWICVVLAVVVILVLILCLCYKYDVCGLRSGIRRNTTRRHIFF